MLDTIIAWLFAAFFLCCIAGVATVRHVQVQRVLWPINMLLMVLIVLLSILSVHNFMTVFHGG